jgi:hypothetical protein
LTSALVGGEWSASRLGRFTPRERAPGTHWIGSWVGPSACLDDMENSDSGVQPVTSLYTDSKQYHHRLLSVTRVTGCRRNERVRITVTSLHYVGAWPVCSATSRTSAGIGEIAPVSPVGVHDPVNWYGRTRVRIALSSKGHQDYVSCDVVIITAGAGKLAVFYA